MKAIKYVLFVLTLMALFSYVIISWTLSNKILNPETSEELTKSRMIEYWGVSYDEVLSQLPKPESFVVSSFDSASIRGMYFSRVDSPECVFILLHGWTETWPSSLKYLPLTNFCNCDLAVYDHRAHGSSGGKYPTGGIKESQDLWYVTEWLRKEKGFNYRQIGWIGGSWGAATALMAASDERNVGFVMADSPYKDWYSAIFERGIREYGSGVSLLALGIMKTVNLRAGINYKDASPLNAAKDIEEPVFLIHSSSDSETYSNQSVEISINLESPDHQFYHTSWQSDHTQDIIKQEEKFTKLFQKFISDIPFNANCK